MKHWTDYHAKNGNITVQRARRIELVPGSFTFPVRALQEAKEPKPDSLEDIPFQSELQSGADVQPEHEPADESTEAVLDALAQPDKSPDDEFFPEIKHTPTGEIIPDCFHWDGTRLVKSYKGSKRPAHIPSDFKEREKLVAEEAEKLAGGSGSAASSSSAAKASKKKKKKKPEPATVARKLRVNPSPSGEQKTAAVCWEVIPEDRPRKAAPAKAELHRPELRDWIKKQDPRIRIQCCF